MKSWSRISNAQNKLFGTKLFQCVVPWLLWQFPLQNYQQVQGKAIHSKYSKHWPYLLATTLDCCCNKRLNHCLNHGLFLSFLNVFGPNFHCQNYVFDFWLRQSMDFENDLISRVPRFTCNFWVCGSWSSLHHGQTINPTENFI